MTSNADKGTRSGPATRRKPRVRTGSDDHAQTVAVLCLRNEGAFLLDWLAHHRAVGIDHVVACSNDCADGTDTMLDRLSELGWITHLRNPGPYGARGIQFTGLRKAARTEAVRDADWLVALDIDEFVNVHVGAHRLADLRAALPEARAITLTWRLFGNAGVRSWEDRPIWEVFTRAAPEVLHWPWRGAMFKTLYRNDGTYRALGVHRPRQPRPDRLAAFPWYDGSGRALHDRYRSQGVFSRFGQSNTQLVQLNHYALGAMDSFVLKAARGRAVHADQPLGLDYWVERNFSDVTDVSMQTLDAPRRAIRAELGADATLAGLHAAAVRWRKRQFDRLMRQERYRALYGRLLMTPPSRPVAGELARDLIAHASRARESVEKMP